MLISLDAWQEQMQSSSQKMNHKLDLAVFPEIKPSDKHITIKHVKIPEAKFTQQE